MLGYSEKACSEPVYISKVAWSACPWYFSRRQVLWKGLPRLWAAGYRNMPPRTPVPAGTASTTLVAEEGDTQSDLTADEWEVRCCSTSFCCVAVLLSPPSPVWRASPLLHPLSLAAYVDTVTLQVYVFTPTLPPDRPLLWPTGISWRAADRVGPPTVLAPRL